MTSGLKVGSAWPALLPWPWNFKHIVHFDKIPLYNGVNLIIGYETLSINTPAEIIAYED